LPGGRGHDQRASKDLTGNQGNRGQVHRGGPGVPHSVRRSVSQRPPRRGQLCWRRHRGQLTGTPLGGCQSGLTLAQGGDDFIGLWKAVGFLLGEDYFPVDANLEHPSPRADQSRLYPVGPLDRFRQTGSARIVVSHPAVFNDHFHWFRSSKAAGGNTAVSVRNPLPTPPAHYGALLSRGPRCAWIIHPAKRRASNASQSIAIWVLWRKRLAQRLGWPLSGDNEVKGQRPCTCEGPRPLARNWMTLPATGWKEKTQAAFKAFCI